MTAPGWHRFKLFGLFPLNAKAIISNGPVMTLCDLWFVDQIGPMGDSHQR